MGVKVRGEPKAEGGRLGRLLPFFIVFWWRTVCPCKMFSGNLVDALETVKSALHFL